MMSKIAVFACAALCAGTLIVRDRSSLTSDLRAPREYTMVRLRPAFDQEGRESGRRGVNILNSLAGDGWEFVTMSPDQAGDFVAVFTKVGSSAPFTRPTALRPDFKAARAAIDVQTIKATIDLYRMQHATNALPDPDAFPSVLTEPGPKGEPALLDPEKLSGGKLLDPWGHPYVYLRHSVSSFEVLSLGADGLPGGTGENVDISSRKESR
jgi:general secretion pathway protein G